MVSRKRSPEASVLLDFSKFPPHKLRDGLYRHRKRRQGEGRTGSVSVAALVFVFFFFTSGDADPGPSDHRNVNLVGSLYLPPIHTRF